MGCSSCGGKRIVQNNNKIMGVNSKQVTKLLTYNNTDFVTKYYIGEEKEYIGEITQINYGYKITNQRMLILKIDYEEDLINFVDNLPEEITSEQSIESIPEQNEIQENKKNKRTRVKKIKETKND